GRVRKRYCALEITTTPQSDTFGRQEFRFVREPLQRFVRPKLCFAIFAQLNQHSHLAGPGRGILRAKLNDFRIKSQSGFEFTILESSPSLGRIVSLVLDQSLRVISGVLGFTIEFQIAESAHSSTQS